MRVFLIAVWLPLGAFAQNLRPGDVMLTGDELAQVLVGQEVEFFDGSTARYGLDGGYAYRYRPEDPPFLGSYQTGEDSAVCVRFDDGASRCDTYVRSGDRLLLLTVDGLRFPVRAQRGLSQ